MRAPAHLAPPSIGGYRVVGRLGRGGFGAVHEGRDAAGRPVAIKIERRGRQHAHETLATESALLGLSHPHIVPIVDAGEHEGRSFVVMPLVRAVTLRELLRRLARQGERLTVDHASRIGADLADALAYLHEGHGLVHRDVGPANVLVDFDGAARLIDFGVAAAAGAPCRQLVGRPAYAPPEQIICEAVRVEQDVYALGLVLYEMTTGRKAFGGETPLAELWRAKMVGPLALPRELARDRRGRIVADVVARCTAPFADDRPSAARVAETLRALASPHRRALGSRVSAAAEETRGAAGSASETVPVCRRSAILAANDAPVPPAVTMFRGSSRLQG